MCSHFFSLISDSLGSVVMHITALHLELVVLAQYISSFLIWLQWWQNVKSCGENVNNTHTYCQNMKKMTNNKTRLKIKLQSFSKLPCKSTQIGIYVLNNLNKASWNYIVYTYHRVASTNARYQFLVKRSQYIRIKNSLHKLGIRNVLLNETGVLELATLRRVLACLVLKHM